MTYGTQLFAMRGALSAQGVEEAHLESELLLAEAAGISRAQLLARMGQRLDSRTTMACQEILRRRLKREPLFYILGRRDFYGREFVVNPSVLIPRPDTEILVEETLRELARLSDGLGHELTIVDVGTGSGAIAVTLALEHPSVRIIATDLSEQALTIARMNADRLGVADRVTFLQSDLLDEVTVRPHLIVSNPPYIPTEEIDRLAPEIARYEPRLALDGGPDGLDAIRRLLGAAAARLEAGGSVLMEIGDDQGPSASSLASAQFPNGTVDILPDLASRPRVVRIRTYV